MSSSRNYVAKKGDTLQDLAAAIGVQPAEIISLNSDLQRSPQIQPNKVYKLPRSPDSNSATAASDLIVEMKARKAEAEAKNS